MARSNRERLPRVNFFDGQRVTETDLDDEQIHHRDLVSTLINDFHGSGVVRDRIFESRVLLDTSDPGYYSDDDEENISEYTLNAGKYDGKPIYLDRQPIDTVYGNRLEVEASGLGAGGRTVTKVLIIGTVYSSLTNSGDLTLEVVDFKTDSTKLTEHYYTRVIAVIFNNFSGGSGKTYYDSSAESENILSSDSKIVIKEAEPLKVFPRTKSVFQTESPNIALNNFITSDPDNSLSDEIKEALGSLYSFNDIYWELDPQEELEFEKDGDQVIAYGQKFLAKANNVQKISLLLSVKKDDEAEAGSEYDFSGDIVISLHQLSTEVQCITDPDPDNLIDFDPDPSPIIEMSYSQADLAELGYSFGADPIIVDFDFSETLVADPNIDPSIEEGQYYAFLVTRRGDNRTGTVLMQKGYDKADRKYDNGQDLNVIESFGKQTSRFLEYDSLNRVYVDDSSSSLWFEVHADAVEVTDGAAYTEDGLLVSLPKTEDYVGDSKVSYFLRDVVLKDVSEGTTNLIVLNREDSFTTPGTHPRTGNFVYTRLEDTPSIMAMTEAEWEEVDEENPPIILARAIDKNVRDAQEISGTFDKPGLVFPNKIIFIEPSSDLLSSNLINRVITPDTQCECNSRYRIIKAECSSIMAGDLDSDDEITSNDIIELLDVVGNTINTETTERKILGGELGLLDFIKSDLNEDDTVDGFDIELLEDALDGYVNFTIDESFNVLTIHLENILEENDYPTIFADTEDSGETTAGADTVIFNTTEDTEALAIRVGDEVIIPADSSDAGTYIVYAKEVGSVGTDVTLSVTDTDGEDVEFGGSSGFSLEVKSGTKVNTFADNLNLMNVPYHDISWKISFISSAHNERFLEVCDLRRYVETNFTEKFEQTCVCDEEVCLEVDECAPVYKNQKVLSNDLFIPSGEIYKEPGVPYHGDIEYSNITIPLPEGSIEDCEIDLYTNFIKAYNGTCKTASGYPAMKFSDGTYVGCEDSGGETDLTKGRVKVSRAIASLYVDGLIDGYAVDGYADESDSTTSAEVVSEAFINHSYTSFEDWTLATSSDASIASVTQNTGPNQPGIFELTTANISAERHGRISYPSGIDDLEDDFIIDFEASRAVWEAGSISFGQISFFATLSITNDDSSTADLKLGWRENSTNGLEIFYSGEIRNSVGDLLSSFDDAVAAGDHVSDDIVFRFRRVNEAVFGMYFDPTIIDLTANPTEQLIKIGSTPEMHPGSGDAEIVFEIAQALNPTPGLSYIVNLNDVNIISDYSSASATDEASIAIGRDSSTYEMTRATATFPVDLTQRTNVVSATLSITAADVISSTDDFNIIPFNIINADNLGIVVDYPLETETSYISTFSPGDVSAGSDIEVDVTGMIIYFLSRTGHLPGFYKAIMIEPSATASSSIDISPSMSLEVAYEDVTTGVIFKIGASMDASTGIVSLKTKNILYDSLNEENRTILNFGVYLKKSGFRNEDITIGLKDLARIGIGTCIPEDVFDEEELCFFISGSTAAGTFVEGPFPCQFHLP